MAREMKPLAERLWAKVDKTASGGCWEWTGYTDDFGYGRLYIDKGTSIRTHRLAYELCVSEIPAGLVVRHTCDNPKCVNPEHLSLGTHADNSSDMMQRSRGKKQFSTESARGEANKNAKLNEGVVRQIRADAGRLSQREMAQRYGVSQWAIGAIVRRKTWAHI